MQSTPASHKLAYPSVRSGGTVESRTRAGLCRTSRRASSQLMTSQRKPMETYYCGHQGNESNNTINLFFCTAISMLVITNRNSFLVLFDKIASVYLI